MRLSGRFWSTKYQLCANSAENENWADCRRQTRCWLEHAIYGCLFPPVAVCAKKSGIRPLQARPLIPSPSQVKAAHPTIAQRDGNRNSRRPQSQSPGRNSRVPGRLENAQQLSRGWCSPNPQGNDGSPYGTLCGGSCCWSSQEMREDGSPPENVPWQLPPKHEWFGSMYASHFSITGRSLLSFPFCKRQYTKRESSPNAT